MDLGSITETEYVPEWNGNRDLPEGERLSLKIVPLRAMDVLHDGTVEDIYSWRDRLKDVSAEAWQALASATPSQLRLLRVVITHTKNLKGFKFGDEAVSAPIEVWPRLSARAWPLAIEVHRHPVSVSNLTERTMAAGRDDRAAAEVMRVLQHKKARSGHMRVRGPDRPFEVRGVHETRSRGEDARHVTRDAGHRTGLVVEDVRVGRREDLVAVTAMRHDTG